MATGLSHDDIQALKNNGNVDLLCKIAGKFVLQYDRLYLGRSRELANEIFKLIAKDASKNVRKKLAEGIKSSRFLSPAMAFHLACDDLEIATPVLEASPVPSERP
jgi:uncharacterized protein (DUF2336 family)